MRDCLILALGGLLAAIAEERILALIDAVIFAPVRRRKILEKRTWKSVTAEEVSKYAEPDRSGHYRLIYRWTVNGRKYRGRFDLHTDNQPFLALYYVRNPGEAVRDLNTIGRVEYQRILFLILVLANIAAAFLLFGPIA